MTPRKLEASMTHSGETQTFTQSDLAHLGDGDVARDFDDDGAPATILQARVAPAHGVGDRPFLRSAGA